MNESVENNVAAQNMYSGLASVSENNDNVHIDMLQIRKSPMKIAQQRSLDVIRDVTMGNDDFCDRCSYSLKRTVCDVTVPAQRRRRLSLNKLLASTRSLSLHSTSDEYLQAQANPPVVESSPSKTPLPIQNKQSMPCSSRAVCFADCNFSNDGESRDQDRDNHDDDSNTVQYGYESLTLNEENELQGHRRKRRRFERRNSKTPAMLMSIISPMFAELHDIIDESAFNYNDSSSVSSKSRKECSHLDTSPINAKGEEITSITGRAHDIGESLVVAESLVNQLRQRTFLFSYEFGRK
jgi:hypothetical protein